MTVLQIMMNNEYIDYVGRNEFGFELFCPTFQSEKYLLYFSHKFP